MLVNWNLLVSAVKLVSFELVTCSFDPITFRFVIPKWWILQHIYSGRSPVEEGGGGKALRISDKFVLILHIFFNNRGKVRKWQKRILQTQRIKQLDKYSISIKYSYLHSSTNRKLFHAFVYVL